MKKVFFVLSLLILVGCSQGDTELHLSLSDIKALCRDVGLKEFAMMNARDSNRATERGLEFIQSGKSSECELEYRIKQQEANKSF
jgi:hypothetical protein